VLRCTAPELVVAAVRGVHAPEESHSGVGVVASRQQ